MSSDKVVAYHHEESKYKLSAYILGFGLSLAFTLAAYLMVSHHAVSRFDLIGLVIVFALCQFVTQAMLFLHLGEETKPRWKLTVFLFMAGIVIIVVFGSLWIMDNLNYRVTIPDEIRYMNSQDVL